MSKPVVFLTMPRAGESARCFDATKGFWHPTRGQCQVRHFPHATSSLPTTFNDAWTTMLNKREELGLTHWAMQHDDIVPEDFWLDIAIPEMDRVGADVLAAVVPIKDCRGLTTTAKDCPEDPWVCRRLTMHEVFERDATWTEPDLLLNTGLWIAKIGPWMEKCLFQQLHRLIVDVDTAKYGSQQVSEDWDFSRQARHWGASLWATRKVQLHHERPQFHNREPWGEWRTDEDWWDYRRIQEGLGKFYGLKPEGISGWRFPADVVGWLSEQEAVALAELTREKNVLEFGSYQGRSTIAMAQGAHHVDAIDTFDGRGTQRPMDCLPGLGANLERYGIDNVTIYRQDLADGISPRRVDVVFIDGAHDLASVRRDARTALRNLRPGGVLVFHDYHDHDEPVKAVVNGLVASGAGELLRVVDTLAVFRPTVEVPCGVT